MSQYVIEFDAEQLRFVGDAIKLNIPEPRQICIDSSHGEMSYAETAKTFDEVLNDLAAGTVASAIIRTSDPRIRYALITSVLRFIFHHWRCGWGQLRLPSRNGPSSGMRS